MVAFGASFNGQALGRSANVPFPSGTPLRPRKILVRRWFLKVHPLGGRQASHLNFCGGICTQMSCRRTAVLVAWTMPWTRPVPASLWAELILLLCCCRRRTTRTRTPARGGRSTTPMAAPSAAPCTTRCTPSGTSSDSQCISSPQRTLRTMLIIQWMVFVFRRPAGHLLVTLKTFLSSLGLQRTHSAASRSAACGQDLTWDHAAEQYEEVLVAAKYQW